MLFPSVAPVSKECAKFSLLFQSRIHNGSASTVPGGDGDDGSLTSISSAVAVAVAVPSD